MKALRIINLYTENLKAWKEVDWFIGRRFVYNNSGKTTVPVVVMTDNNFMQKVDETCSGLKSVKRNLSEAASNVENHMTKERMERQISEIETCLRECESIAEEMKNK